MKFIIKDLASNVFFGTGVSEKFLSEKEGTHVLLSASDIDEYTISIGKKQFIIPKAIKKIPRQEFLEAGDFLFYINSANKPSVVHYNGDLLPHTVLPNEDIIVLRTYNSYLKNYLQLKRYQDKILKSIISYSDFLNLKNRIENYSFNFEKSPLIETELEIEEVQEKVIEEEIKSKRAISDVQMIQKTQGLSTVIARIKEKEIDLNTKFQRTASIWDEDKKSKLIESILLQFPIPAFYFDGSNDDNWLIIDGLQRLCTVKEFVIDNTLVLSDLDYLHELHGKTWNELGRKEQRKILEFEVVVYLVPAGTPKEIKYNLFKRINSGALVLKDQEIRHALNQGKPADVLIKFSRFKEFKETVQLGEKLIQRMEDREIVLRYLAFRMTNYKEYSGNIKKFLDNSMEKIETLTDEELRDLETDFKHSLRICQKIFEEHTFRRSIIDDKERNRRFSKVLYEPWIFAVSNLDISHRGKLLENKRKIVSSFKGIMRGESVGSESEYEFDSLINQQSYSSARLIERFKIIENLVNHFAK